MQSIQTEDDVAFTEEDHVPALQSIQESEEVAPITGDHDPTLHE
jgi:hypothetical protein